jgi:hypothetical protein
MQGELIMCKCAGLFTKSLLVWAELLLILLVSLSDSVEDGERVTHPSELKDVEWHNWTAIYGYPMLGPYHPMCCPSSDTVLPLWLRSQVRGQRVAMT